MPLTKPGRRRVFLLRFGVAGKFLIRNPPSAQIQPQAPNWDPNRVAILVSSPRGDAAPSPVSRGRWRNHRPVADGVLLPDSTAPTTAAAAFAVPDPATTLVALPNASTSAAELAVFVEFAIRSYMILRPKFLRQNVPATTNVASGSQNAGSGIASNPTNQLATGSVAPVFDFYSGLPKRPSIFMEHTVARFEKYLTECCQWIEEVEQLVMMDTSRMSSNSLEALPQVISNVHDFFIHVAAKVENLHEYVESMKTAYLADQRRRGDGNDPFLEANRREAAKQEVAARRVHPTLHLPAISAQSTTQVSGAFASSAIPVSSTLQPSGAPSAASSGGGFSLFSTPSSAPAATSSSLFSTPTASAPSTLFGSSVFSPQSTPFGTPSTSLFGSTQTPSGFATNTPFGSTPATGSSSLFSTPTLTATGTS
ncbi:hypothetical protein GW17_00034974 [Ensete ventricosum]|nr:hypothetical protein GW17_00034974 [Ensete ventricosum]RZR83037.1 hypothetical protein BHM03_00009586 [Ensete ventricosum]